MRGESEKIWEFWAKSEKNKGNLSYCILLCLFQKKFRFVVCKSMLLENMYQQHQNEI